MLTLKLDQLAELYPEHIWLTIADSDRQAAAQAEQYPYSHDTARARATLNTLCLECLKRELPETLDRPDTIAPATDDLAKRWEFVTGFSVTIGDVPLVVIPTDTLTLDELRVPREWVDIPSDHQWAAPYYVACQVDLEDDWVRIAGYATHDDVKAGAYDRVDRTYSLPVSNLHENIYTIWHLREHCPDPQPQVESLPDLSDSVAESLIRHYSQPMPYSPRLLPEPEGGDRWLALLANPSHLDQLHTCRTSPQQERVSIGETLVTITREARAVVITAWRSLQDLVNPPEFAMAIARSAQINPMSKGCEVLLDGQRFNLAIVYQLTNDPEELRAQIKVNSPDPQASLPVGLTLDVRDEQGDLLDGDRVNPGQPKDVLEASILGAAGEAYQLELSLLGNSAMLPEEFPTHPSPDTSQHLPWFPYLR
ncbi:MAG: DUF1822 family protein [Cyanobacteria bacterium]|nr:DUF1822 family protein [Cyanobacteriota bacterium]MDW8199801.1 DUF1822 family protein [Cyanobacteriota bacterium SKYGB_h_bin112]